MPRAGKPRRQPRRAPRARSEEEEASKRNCPLGCGVWSAVAGVAATCIVSTWRLGAHVSDRIDEVEIQTLTRVPTPEVPLASHGEALAAFLARTVQPAAPHASPSQAGGASEPRAGSSGAPAAPGAAPAGGACSEEVGYANSQIYGGADSSKVASARECRARCAESNTCMCWSWKDDGFCRWGYAERCVHVGSPDNSHWRFGSCERPGHTAPPKFAGAAKAQPVHPVATAAPAWRACAQASAAQSVASLPAQPAQIPVLVIAYARPQYLRRALDSVLRHRPSAGAFPLLASQDGDHQEVAQLLQEHLRRGDLARHLRFTPPPELVQSSRLRKAPGKGYQRLAAHYRWALDQMFEDLGHEQLIVLEDDLEVAPDFFGYFAATLPLLRADPCLFCVSAWNDNGRPEVAANSRAVYRTDFFPGLGWMLLRTFWREIRARWPTAYWDEYVRRGDVRLGRHCLRPEVSRTHTFGEVGVSQGQFYHTHLKKMVLNSDAVNWTAADLTFVSSVAHFDQFLTDQLKEAEVVAFESLRALTNTGQARKLVVRYVDSDWKRYAQFFGLTEDIKEGVRRGSYHGVLAFTWRGHRLFLVRDWPQA